MKVAILAGGLGTRLQEKTRTIPKPMVEIGGMPILWHIMKLYAHHGYNEFVIALGYKGHIIKDFFLNYRHRSNSLTINLKDGDVTVQNNAAEDWTIHLLDTGLNTMTGGRVKQVSNFIGNQPFMLTYGDGVANINISELVKHHQNHNAIATVTAVRPTARFGAISFDGDKVTNFQEKPQTEAGWVNGGFFVLEPDIANYIEGDHTIFERQPLEQVASEGKMTAYKHHQFWQCMDTLRDVNLLNQLWDQNQAEWRIWND